jgi:hypothetical protein
MAAAHHSHGVRSEDGDRDRDPLTGTFEWLPRTSTISDGIVANFDGHGRPGASILARSLFGAYGGLTCIWR